MTDSLITKGVPLKRMSESLKKLQTLLQRFFRTDTADLDFGIYRIINSRNEAIPLSNILLNIGGGGAASWSINRNSWLETAKRVHCIATQIINFLSHIEEFQKRLWLKKKFILSTNYCLTLDRVPEEFYPEITQNTAQLEEWKDLFAIHEIDSNFICADYTEQLSVDFLKENPNLILDTCHFNSDFKNRLLACFDGIDSETNGLLIHGQNFQELNLLAEKYRGSLKTEVPTVI